MTTASEIREHCLLKKRRNVKVTLVKVLRRNPTAAAAMTHIMVKVLNDEKLKGLFNKLKDLEKEVGNSIGWCHILPQDVPVESESENGPISPIKIEVSPISMNGIQERDEKSKLFVNPKQIEEDTKEQ